VSLCNAGNYVKSALAGKLTVGGKDLSGVAVLAIGMFAPKFVKSPMLKSVFDGMIVPVVFPLLLHLYQHYL